VFLVHFKYSGYCRAPSGLRAAGKLIPFASAFFASRAITRQPDFYALAVLTVKGRSSPGKLSQFLPCQKSKRNTLTNFDFSNIITRVNFDYSISR
jgi:hypothetical protein